MDMIKIEFPSDRPDIARHLGTALYYIGKSDDTESLLDEEIEPGSDEGKHQQHLKDTGTSEEEITSVTNNAGSNDNGGFNQEELDGSENLEKRDPNGVAYNAEMCANAAKPFYASGKRTGQWKKRQGVGDDEYEGWYANALANLAPEDDGEPSVNTADAFGGQDSSDDVEPVIPHDAGTLMAWVAEMQSAGRLTQEMVNAAYVQAGLGMVDIFEGPDKAPDVIAGRVGEIHNILQGWAQQ